MVIEQISAFYTQLAAGLEAELSRHRIPLVVHLCGTPSDRPAGPGGDRGAGRTAVADPGPDAGMVSLARLLRDGRPSAVLVTPLTRPEPGAVLTRILDDHPGLPRIHLGLPGGDCSVRVDNAAGMRLLAGHLVTDRGVRRPMIVRGIPHQPDSQERERAVLAELARLGIRIGTGRLVDGLFDREISYHVVRRALTADPSVDAVVAFNDRSALGALDAVRAVDRRVPNDVVVTGFDDEEVASLCRPGLTTVSQDPREQGALAGRYLVRVLAGEHPGEVRVPVRLVPRGSTGASRDTAADDARSADRLWAQVSTLDSALAMSRALMSCHTLEEVLERLAEDLPLLGVVRGHLVLPDERTAGGRDRMVVLTVPGGNREYHPLDEPLDYPGWFHRNLTGMVDPGTLMVQPLRIADGPPGYLVLERGRHGADSYVPESLANDLSRVLGTITRTRRLESEVAARRAAQEALAHLAHHDPVTGLGNRTAFLAQADPLIVTAGADGAALLLVDLDRFKDVNDSLGHAVGDALLRAVAGRLSALSGPAGRGTRVWRLAGDEYAVLAPGAGDPELALALARDVQAALRDRFVLDGVTLELEASVGVACAPRHAPDARALLRSADVALYRAKSERASVTVYHPSHRAEAPRRLALFGELRQALAGDQLVVHYQPIVDTASGRVSSLEALVRWQHPTRGLLLPGDFLEVAEQTALIHPITSFVLDRALGDCRGWRRQGLDLRMAVNLSARRLTDSDLAHEVTGLLRRHAVPASRLELEVTESAAMADPTRALQILAGLRELGVQLSVDDFGTGHASLAYLSRLPIGSLKIDRSFITTMESDLTNRTIVRSILDLARNLGLEVIAEGIETASAYDTLAAAASVKAQGYWLARPAPAAAIPGLVSDLQQRLAGRPDPTPVPRQRGPEPRGAATPGGSDRPV
jgi:diguanylate cyclase (GGDEF)-like protein